MIARAVDAATAAGIPIAVIQHSAGVGAPVFAPGTPEFDLHPVIEGRKTGAWKSVVKQYGSVYAGTDLAAWLWKHDVDTVTLMGYMTNNCVLASAVEADTAAWTEALVSRQALTRSDLGSSAVAGSQARLPDVATGSGFPPVFIGWEAWEHRQHSRCCTHGDQAPTNFKDCLHEVDSSRRRDPE